MHHYRESIIIEGPPFSGKTTLANKLSGVTGLPVKKHTLYAQLPNRQLLKVYLRDFIAHDPRILDCQWVSEYLQTTKLSQLSICAFWKLHEALGIVIIMCLPPWHLIERSCKNSHVSNDGLSTIKELYLAYETFVNINLDKKTIIKYDYEHGSGTFILHSILGSVREIQSLSYFSYQHKPFGLREIG